MTQLQNRSQEETVEIEEISNELTIETIDTQINERITAPEDAQRSKKTINSCMYKIKPRLLPGEMSTLFKLGCRLNNGFRSHIEKKAIILQYLDEIFDRKLFHFEDIHDPYYELSPAEQTKIDLTMKLSETIRKEVKQYVYSNTLLNSFNSMYDTNINIEQLLKIEEENLKDLLSNENINHLDHLKTVYEEVLKLKKDVENERKIKNRLNNTDSIILNQKSPLSSAEKLIEKKFKYKNLKTIHFCGDAFWQWTGPCYEELRNNRVRQFIYDFLNKAKVEIKDNEKTALVDFNPNQAKVNNVLDAFKATCECNLIPESGASWIEQKQLPKIQNIIVFKNGILDVEQWMNGKKPQLLDHTPLLMNPGYLPFDFDPSYQEPKKWIAFLQSVWPNDQQSIDTLQEWFGYSLTQETCYHKILLIVGPPRSGKGTIGRTQRALLGERNVVGPTLSSLATPFGLQPWLNKSHAIISDARLSGKSEQGIIIERLLSISGEDSLTIDRKHRDPITTKLATRITIMTNELPNLGDSSGAIVNRYIILPMTKSWLGEEDLDLDIRINKELPQILIWALEGLKRLKERKRFNQPESAKQHFDEIMAMSSPVKTFIKERCELDQKKYIEVQSLFKAWVRWCEDTGHERPGNSQVFGRNLRAALPALKINQMRLGADVSVCDSEDESLDTFEESRDKNKRIRIYEGIGLSILPN